MKKQGNKLGHQAPKKYRFNRYFNYIYIKGDLHYCHSHDFVYNCVEEERKLYNAEPCYYTDWRYVDGKGNYFKDCYIYQTRSKWGKKFGLTLKTCMRITKKVRNIPIETIIEFKRDWYYTAKKSGNVIDLSYHFKIKIRKENIFDPKYEINRPSYSRNFDNCERSQKLTDALRANGFIVSVSKGNPNFIMGMIARATEYTTGKRGEDHEDGGQIAVAYGHGRMIGFSSGENNFRGYVNGCENILYDFFEEFNKWSQCIEIHKTTPINEIIKELTDDKLNED